MKSHGDWLPSEQLACPWLPNTHLRLLVLSPPLEGWWINSRAVTNGSVSKQGSHRPSKSAESERAGERKKKLSEHALIAYKPQHEQPGIFVTHRWNVWQRLWWAMGRASCLGGGRGGCAVEPGAQPAECFPRTFLYSMHYEIWWEDKAWKQKEIPRRKVKQKNKTAW